jgi:hypothetical protein
MNTSCEEDYVVFMRGRGIVGDDPMDAERELAHCATYEEAEWVRQENETRSRKCIIRYLGPAGGGD